MKVRAGPCGIHLFDRATGVNLLIDEASVPAAKWSAAPRQVSVALTNACDLRCPYCYAPKTPASLDSQRLVPWLDELDGNGCLGIGLGGGEPTLHRDLPRLCRYTTEHTDLSVTLTTHAQRLDDRLMGELSGHVHFVRVSMDGVGATYDALRNRPFASLCQRFERVRQLARFGINFLVNALTLPDLDAAVALASDVGAEEFLLLPEQPRRGRGGIDSRTTQALCDWVRLYRGTIPLSVSEAGSAGLPTCDPLEAEDGLRAYAHLDASGVLRRTSFHEEGVPVGNDGIVQALRALALVTGDNT